MAKRTFTYWTEWSDRSEYSPQTHGQLPEEIELPDGERLDLSIDDRYARPSRSGYHQIHPEVRVKWSYWGDDGTKSMGRAGGKMEILAPKDSIFYFVCRCTWCGEEMGSVPESKLGKDGRPAPRIHKGCEFWSREGL